MSKEITVKTTGIKHYDSEKIEDVIKMSVVLKNYVVKQGLFTNIKGKNYAHVEGWQFAGGMLGLSPKIISVEDLSNDKEKKWKATAELVLDSTGKVVGNGFALCSSAEATKKNFEEYAVLSMAQTRAIGKAYRNRVGWVMKLAGYEGTPSEEMRKVDEVVKEPVIQMDHSESQEIEEYLCMAKGCGADITKQEAEYSKKIYGKSLCRKCQKESKTKR